MIAPANSSKEMRRIGVQKELSSNINEIATVRSVVYVMPCSRLAAICCHHSMAIPLGTRKEGGVCVTVCSVLFRMNACREWENWRTMEISNGISILTTVCDHSKILFI
jgi:hypothetical protein